MPIASAWAGTVGSDLVISARAGISLIADPAHPAASAPAAGNATQGATVSLTASGVNSSATVGAGLAVGGQLPLSGSLTRLGDGVGITSTMSGLDDGQPASTDGLFGDYALSLKNNSASHAYKVSLKIDYANSVQATGPAAEADGAFNIGLITLTRGDTTLFFTNLTSDTAFGDKRDVSFTGTHGQNLDDAGTRSVELRLQPGETIELRGQHDLRGGASRMGTSYRGGLKAFISLAEVADLAAAPPATGTTAAATRPEPAQDAPSSRRRQAGTALLVLGSVILLLVLRRRRK